MPDSRPPSLFGRLDETVARAQVQMAVSAQVCALLAWAWPDDRQRFEDAVGIFRECGLDYVELMSSFIESTGGHASNSTAAQWVCGYMANTVQQCAANAAIEAAVPDAIPEWMDTRDA